MNAHTNRIIACTGLLVAMALATPVWGANLLVNPEFDPTPSLLLMTQVWPPSPSSILSQWGAENGAIVGVDDGVTPLTANTMLAEYNTGNYSQTAQVIDISAYAPGSSYTLSAYFNANVTGAQAYVNLSYYDASYANVGGAPSAGLVLDGSPSSWEQISLTDTAPLTAKYVVSQVMYLDSTLLTSDGVVHAGYVDSASLTLVPEPSTLGLIFTAVVGLVGCAWRKGKNV